MVLTLPERCHTYKEVGKYDNVRSVISAGTFAVLMSSRRQAQNRVKSTPVTVTIDKQLLDWLEYHLEIRTFANRSHAVNQAIGFLKWTLETNPQAFYGERPVRQPQPTRQPQPDINQNRPH